MTNEEKLSKLEQEVIEIVNVQLKQGEEMRPWQSKIAAKKIINLAKEEIQEKTKPMLLNDYLKLIQDEDARIELCIDEDDEPEYKYTSFWLSDYRKNSSTANEYADFNVTGISFLPETDNSCCIQITIEEPIYNG
jgi:hypothetical protein